VLALATAGASAVVGSAVVLLATVAVMRRTNNHSEVVTSHATSLEGAAMDEIHRARRYGRPLTVVAFATDRRSHAAAIATELSSRARANDIVGFHGGSTVVAVLPETDDDAATTVVRRLSEAIDDALASRVRVGMTAFPRDEVTWIGLRDSLADAVRCLDDFRDSPEPELAHDLAPHRIAAPAHVVDPAA
jgi:diguanylate cyclase with GGDEF domain